MMMGLKLLYLVTHIFHSRTLETKANRLIAGIIDSVVGYVPMMIMAFVTGATGIGALMYVGYLVTIGYYLFKDALLGGQSIGKKAMK